ncbi:MAG TPA: winged helix-turn-helix domain-containing protein [Methanothrix sp.]|nr:winged helix-turn-helix domain-containing protein [Methanothrix sp.]
MTETTVESIFGVNAGIVWEALNLNGPSTIGNLVKSTSLSREEVYGALGWLARENKIVVERRGRAMVYSLRDAEARWNAFKGTTIGDSAPQEQTTNNTSAPPEKTTEARKAKAPTLSLETAKWALDFILSEFEANREPTSEQVSKELGMDSRQLGKALSKLDIKSKSIRRGGKSVKIYPLALKARVWELAALDADGLQKMVEVKTRAMEDDKEHSREHFTVFD